MKNIVSCRPTCYDLSLPEALAELKKLGIDYAEINIPENEDYEGIAKIAAEAGVAISTLGCSLLVGDSENQAFVERSVEGAALIGVELIFLAVSLVGDATYEQGIEELKRIGAIAAEKNVKFSIETHVPYGYNATEALKTLELVDSPGIGYNFDTANIYYYNEKGIDTVEELGKASHIVTSVHLKESLCGEPKSFDFPVFGAGIVDFPEVFRILGGRGFRGPYTMELEGPLVDGLSTRERSSKVKACLDYLKSIGAV